MGRSTSNLEAPASNNPRLVRRRFDGEHLIDARLSNHRRATPNRTLTLTVEVREVILHTGNHQVDRTAAYTLGAMPPRPTTYNPPPAHSSRVVPRSIATALAGWNMSAGNTWPYTTFCPTQCGANSDSHVFTLSTGFSNECGNVSACVTSTLRRSGGHWHITSSPLVIEQPGTQFNTQLGVATTFIWTTNPNLQDTRVDPNDYSMIYVHLPAIVLHESGHVMGLSDLYRLNRGYGSVMEEPVTQIRPTRFDLNYLKQVYREYWG